MKHAQPRGLSRRRVEKVLSITKSNRSTANRIDVLSRHFVGHPYKQNPLIGSVDTPEVFTASLNGFDCVTYIETMLALARATDMESFTEGLRKIRYERGHIEWKRRNHYMSGWIRSNAREGIVRPLTLPPGLAISRERLLNVVPGLPQKRIQLKCVPKSALDRLEPRTGDLIFFASTRKNLDVFHGGIIVQNGKRFLLRHASRSRGAVVEQALNGFLKANRMAGVIVVRPRDITRHVR